MSTMGHITGEESLGLGRRPYLFLERGEKGRRKGGRKTSMCGCLSHGHHRGLASNPGMCRDWESNWWPFGLQPTLSPLSYTSQGGAHIFLMGNKYTLLCSAGRHYYDLQAVSKFGLCFGNSYSLCFLRLFIAQISSKGQFKGHSRILLLR